MPPVIFPGGVQVRLVWSAAGIPQALNVLNYQNPGAVEVNQTLANAIGTTIKGLFTSSGLATYIASGVALRNIGVRNVSTPNMPEFVDAAAAVPGTDVTSMLPPALSLVITLRTGMTGKSFRGRVYLWGYSEAASATTIDAAAQTASVAFVNGLRTSMLGTHNLVHAVGSRFSEGELRPSALLTPVVSCVSRNASFEVQRRRTLAGSGGQLNWGQQWLIDHPDPPQLVKAASSSSKNA